MSDDFINIKNKYLEAKKLYNTGNETMTDDEFDELEEFIRLNYPKELEKDDFTDYTDVQVPENCNDNEKLPFFMPSLKKIKTTHELNLWLKKHVPHDTKKVSITAKNDGTSGLWIPKSMKLMTRYDGIQGRDVSVHVPKIKGLIRNKEIEDYIIRGEIMLRKDSELVTKTDKPFRNIGSGIINTRCATEKASELIFIAYEISYPSNFTPIEQLKILKNNGFSVARNVEADIKSLNEDFLADIFDQFEKEDPHYGYDGVVISPDFALDENYQHEIKNGSIVLPENKRAWKVRKNQKGYETIVKEIEWNTKTRGKLVPVIVYEKIIIDDVECTRTSGHNAKTIFENNLGPGSKIYMIRSNDTIPKLEKVLTHCDDGPQMPTQFEWFWDDEKVNIYRREKSVEEKISSIEKSLSALGAKNVGEAKIKEMCLKGFDSIHLIYKASKNDFLKLDRVAEKTAQNIYNGLREKKDIWKVSDLMVASQLFPDMIGVAKLNLIFSVDNDWKNWKYENIDTKKPSGLTSETLNKILNCLDRFKLWYDEFIEIVGDLNDNEVVNNSDGKKIVFTGFRNQKWKDIITLKGHKIMDDVSKQTNLVVFSGESTKTKKAETLGIKTVDVESFDPNTFDFSMI